MELDEKQFISLLNENKDRAYQMLVNAYASQIYNVCFNLLRNQEDAEDVTQEVFTTVFLSIDTFSGSSKLSTWIYAIALNKSKEFLRNKTRKKRFGFMLRIDNEESFSVTNSIVEFEHPGVLLENKQRTELLFSAIDKLAETQREAYLLHKIEGLSYTEIADIMKTSVSSVESLMFRAKKRLQELLKDYYEKNER